MAAKMSFFPVDNGDMTLVVFESGRKILIDCNIRSLEGDDPPPDVLTQLKERLDKDEKGRYYVDAFLLSHPDEDHCRGLKKNLHLGAPEDYPTTTDKIFIRELWSSPLIFRRKSKHHTLCDDASAFNAEARRRVRKYRENYSQVADGDRILILGEDEDPKKQEGLSAIVVKADTTFSKINGQYDTSFSAYLLAPQPKGSEEEEEERSKNNSSVILNFKIYAGNNYDACRFLCGGDADVTIWEKLWARHKNATAALTYDILLTPHHCSWHCFSHDSSSELGDDAKVSEDARSALSEARQHARIVGSCKKIVNDDDDPPSYRAAQEYRAIKKRVNGYFDESTDFKGEPMDLDITSAGPSRKAARTARGGGGGAASGAIGNEVIGHGNR